MRSRVFAIGVLAYLALVIGAYTTGMSWLGAVASMVLISLLLAPALQRRVAGAWLAWILISAALAVLGVRGYGRFALDAMPVLINAALCIVFARTLRAGQQTLIARFISVIEGPHRLHLAGVADYARGLTWAWALLLGAQTVLLAVILTWSVLAASGRIAAAGPAWAAYLHVGSFALVPLFLVLEYAWRRWHLRHLPHLPMPVFIARLAQSWPALLRDLQAPGTVAQR